LQCLGVAFGDALAQRLGLAWVAVEDDQGRDPALVVEGTSILVFPLTSISKRMERGEQVDVHGLFESACRTIERIRAEEAPKAGT
jgi:NAD-dependent SIR2 family protein deacetylase